MAIHVDEYNGVCVLAPDGGLSGEVAAEAERLCDQRLSGPNATSFVFDLCRCDSVDSAGLEMLCRLRRRCDVAGTRLALARTGPNVAKVLQVTRLAARFDCHPDLAGAVAAAR
jgi:anti-anti-sigma factor